MTEPNKEGVSPKPETFIREDVLALMELARRPLESRIAELEKEKAELLFQFNALDAETDEYHTRLGKANEYLERNGMPTF